MVRKNSFLEKFDNQAVQVTVDFDLYVFILHMHRMHDSAYRSRIMLLYRYLHIFDYYDSFQCIPCVAVLIMGNWNIPGLWGARNRSSHIFHRQKRFIASDGTLKAYSIVELECEKALLQLMIYISPLTKTSQQLGVNGLKKISVK